MENIVSNSNMNICFYILGFILALGGIPVEAGEYCTYRYGCYDFYSGYYSYCYKQTYCDYGCCGTSYSSYSEACCTYNAAGVISGAVIGSLVGLGLVIALIVYCCVAASKSGTHRGIVVQPANTTHIHTVAISNTAVAPGPSSYPGRYGPAMYGNPTVQQAPPPYIESSGANYAAYPPPPPPPKY